jgi:hypothetical protein
MNILRYAQDRLRTKKWRLIPLAESSVEVYLNTSLAGAASENTRFNFPSSPYSLLSKVSAQAYLGGLLE